MQYINFTEEPVSDFQTSFYHLYKSSITGDYSEEVEIIEQPSFIKIDGTEGRYFSVYN